MASPVLVVDDSRVMRRIIIRALNDIGLNEVVEANDGDEALAEFAKQEFMLVLTDWNMPGKTGLELASDRDVAGIQRLNDGLFNKGILSLFSPANTGDLLAGTWGSGIFRVRSGWTTKISRSSKRSANLCRIFEQRTTRTSFPVLKRILKISG